jgi:hypothetical protein
MLIFNMSGDRAMRDATARFDLPQAMQESTVTIKGQTTPPRDVRQALGLHR